MDESRRDRINQRIQEARQLSAFSIPGELANETEWLLADLVAKESTIKAMLTETQTANARAVAAEQQLSAQANERYTERKDHADVVSAIRSQLESQTKRAIDLQSKLDAIVSDTVTNSAPKTTSETALGLRQRFIEATAKDNCEFATHRPVYFHDLLRLCDAIDSAPCSSAEAVSRACAAFVGTVFKIDPTTRTLQQQEWSTIGRELKKHLGYEPTVYSDRVELRDGRVWYDYEYQKLTFTMH